jgi:nucleotidyltransferase substrate binding protein (TIGR01987 family)
MSARPDIRWKQRFTNLAQAYRLLEEALDRGTANLNQLEREGLTQRFEFTFELAWKTLKDYLDESGITLPIATPREVIKTAFAANIIDDGPLWLSMLDHRYLLSHSYDEQRFDEAVRAIDQKYNTLLRSLMEFFESRLSE